MQEKPLPRSKELILVVDDDVRMLRMMQRMLELEGYRVLQASDGQDALEMFSSQTPDLVLLDIMMPVMDGYEVCKRIRQTSRTPVIMVTAKGDDDEKVKGLDAGADDYVAKPFSSQELAARVRAVLRRSSYLDTDMVPFSRDGLIIDYSAHKVSLDDNDLDLTATEYKLLVYLVQNQGRVLTPDQILTAVWGDEYCGDYTLVRVNITRLRHKLNDDRKSPRFISTKHGIGYLFLAA